MRLGVLTTSYPQGPDDSAGNFVMHMAHALAERGHQVEVCAPEPAGLALKVHHANVTTHWVPYLRPRRWQRTFYRAGVLDNLKHDPLAWLGLAPFMIAFAHNVRRRAAEWDAVLSHWALPCGLIGGRHRAHRPHVAVLHSADVHLLQRLPFAAQLAEKIVSDADHLVFVSAALKENFRALLPTSAHDGFDGKARVLPMGFTPQLEHGATREALRAQLGMTKFTLLMLARLVPVKGPEIALAALGGNSGIECWVAGDGPQRQHLQALGAKLNSPVRWLGQVPSSIRDQLLKAADVLVVPSRVLPSGRTEGMPCCIIEAMHAGLPVVASAVGGIPEWVRHGQTGWLVAPGDAAALRKVIQHLQNNPSHGTRCAEAARQAVEHLSWNHQAALYEQLLTR
jgi:glycosyltransferase involved in cell wall biosynthesis